MKQWDKKFQMENETFWCCVGLSPTHPGHYAEETVSHHLIGRRHQAKRWDKSNQIRLCHEHHRLIHQLGHKRFCELYYFSAAESRPGPPEAH